jgi:hypothetical protein
MQVPEALERLRRDKTPITFPAVARRALLTEQDREFQQFNG